MQSQMAFGIGGGLLFGVLLSVAISGTLTDGKIARAVGKTGDASAAAMSAATEAFEARIAELEAALSESAAETDQRLVALQTETAAELAALSAAAEGHASDLAGLVERMAGPSGSAAVPTPEPVALDMPTSDTLGVGETAIFADGAVRVFVSAMDQDSGSARLSVNGETQSLLIGASAAVTLDAGECVVALADVTDAGAVVGSDCGTETPEAVAADIPPAPEEGHTPGTTVSLAEGAMRVFVSALAADGSSARLAVNGIDTVTVASGSSIEVAAGDQTCTLTVTGVGNGLVGLDGSCS